MSGKTICDCHLHTHCSVDGFAAVPEILNTAALKGIYAVTITDHCDITQQTAEEMKCNIDKSVKEIIDQNKVNRSVKLLTGVELGQPLHNPAESAEILSRHTYDFVLASVHNLRNRQDFFDMDFSAEGIDVNKILEAYFDELAEMAEWGGFDSLAHLTYPLRYIVGKHRIPVDLKRFREQIDNILTLLVKKGKALEINSSGLRQPIGELIPGEPIIRRFYELGGALVTVGSDAHRARYIGTGIQYALTTAARCGFKYYALYQNRIPTMISL